MIFWYKNRHPKNISYPYPESENRITTIGRSLREFIFSEVCFVFVSMILRSHAQVTSRERFPTSFTDWDESSYLSPDRKRSREEVGGKVEGEARKRKVIEEPEET